MIQPSNSAITISAESNVSDEGEVPLSHYEQNDLGVQVSVQVNIQASVQVIKKLDPVAESSQNS